jgi:TonB family protein
MLSLGGIIMKNIWLLLFFFASLNVFCQGISDQQNTIKYVSISSLNSNNRKNILDIDDYISILNDKKVSIVFTTDNLFAFENNSVIYTLPRNGYKTLFDFYEGKKRKFRSSSSYYSALELNLASQDELDSYLSDLQNTNSLRLYSNSEIITEDYLPMGKISEPPKFDERQVMGTLIYPSEALRAAIEGRVILELFVDNEGQVQHIRILREEPLNKGFGDAAANAFLGKKGEPAKANGKPVASRYRYPVSFRIK